MTIMLKSLRVTSDMDSSGYVRGAAQKVIADKSMISSGEAMAASLATSDAALNKAVPGMARLSRTWIDGYSEAEKFERAVRQVGNAMDKGMSLDRAVTILGAVSGKFGMMADKTQLAKQGYVSLAPAIEQVNLKLEAQAMIAARAASAMNAGTYQKALNQNLGVRDDFGGASRAADIAAYGEELDRLAAKYDPLEAAMQSYRKDLEEVSRAHKVGAISAQQMIAETVKAQQALQNASSKSLQGGPDPSQLLGRGTPISGSAKASAAVFEEARLEQEKMEQSLQRLRMAIDPVSIAYDAMNAELAEYRTLLNAGMITNEQFNVAQMQSQDNYTKTVHHMKQFGNGVQLNRHELANLSYQLNDIAVMMASGQAPFMLFMQQGMQIGQLLGPQGLQQGVKSLGSGIISFLTNPVNLAVIAFAALAAGAALAYHEIMGPSEKVSDMLKKQKEIIDSLKDAYAEVGREVGKMSPESAMVIEFEAQLNIEKSRTKIQDSLADLLKDITPKWTTSGRGGAVQFNKENVPFIPAIEGLKKALAGGGGDVTKFSEDLVKIANSTPDERIKKTANSLIELNKEIGVLQRQTDSLSLALDPLASKLSNAYGKPRSFLGDEPNFKDLYSFLPELKTKQDQLKESYDGFLKTYGGDTALLAEANRVVAQTQAQWNAEMERSVKLGALDLAAIDAKTPAQKAALAAERERVNAIGELVTAEELAIRVTNASTLAYREATKAISDQNKARRHSYEDSVKSAKLDLDLIGASAGKVAELRANWQLFIDLRKQAEDTGMAFDQAQYERYTALNKELGQLTQAQNNKKLENDLEFQGKIKNYSPQMKNIYERLRGAGIEEGTQAWFKYAAAIKHAEDAEKSIGSGLSNGFYKIVEDASDWASSSEKLVTDMYNGLEDVWVNFAKTGEINFSAMIDAMIEDLARLSYKLIMSGLLDSIGGGGGLGGGMSSVFQTIQESLGFATTLYADGGAFSAGSEVKTFGRGAVMSKPTAFKTRGGMGVMAERNEEAIVPLTRTADGKLGITSVGGGGVVVNVTSTVINNSSAVKVEQRQTEDGSGNVNIVTLVEDLVIKTMSGPKGAKIMGSTYGIGKQPIRRANG